MAIKNIMEDVVASTLSEVFKNPEVKKLFSQSPEEYTNDIMAYVLNRVPGRYITGERGVLHGKLDAKYMFQQKTDILILIHEAIDVIISRRQAPSDKTFTDAFYSNLFPHMLGQVLEETSFSVIPEVEVVLRRKGELVKMIDKSWQNPYKTNYGTKGYYHFWPEYDKATMDGEKSISFTIEFSHPEFISKSIEIEVPIIDNLNMDKSKLSPIVLLEFKPDADISLLYK